MRALSATLVAALFLPLPTLAQSTTQVCTGLCQQQISCPAGQDTTITGTVYAPNGTDPLPNVLVYIPNASVDPFTAGVSCPVPGAPPSGSPLVGAITASDGTFTLTNVPVGSSIPVVIQAGRWRRQLTLPGTAACTNTTLPAEMSRMPRRQSEGDIPKIAIATGSVDQVECVLRKVGIDDAEFTNPSGTGRINLYSGDTGLNPPSPNAAGARIDASTPTESTLMDNFANLSQYDALMLPCEGANYLRSPTQLASFRQYANAGGRVYASHFSYAWMYQNPPFDTVVNWSVNQAQLMDGIATVNTTFPDGDTLAQWLQLVGATTTQGQMSISTLRHDINGVNAPTLSWLALNDAANGNPVMQFTFDAPVVPAANQCGRVLFNEYHVENPPAGTNPTNKTFPSECSAGAMTPQEKLLEYSLFDLTNQGGEPTVSPTTYDFGSEPVGFPTASQTFTLKNTSIFTIKIGQRTASGDFVVTGTTCSSVPAGATCTVDAAFRPTALGSRTGTLSIPSNSKVVIAALTGTGVPALTTNATSINFGNVDVGATATRYLTFTNSAPGPVTLPTIVASGDFSAPGNSCTTIPSGATCTVNIVFQPSTTGPRTGTLSTTSGDPAIFGLPTQLTGNGVDFTISLNPTSGNLIAGRTIDTVATVTPVAGFASPVNISCTTATPASTCAASLISFIPSPTNSTIAIATTSQYTVVGYGGVIPLLGLGTGMLLCCTRRRSHLAARLVLWTIVLATAGLFATGCSGKYPDKNAVYTAPGTYTYTVTASDGFLTHSATYTLTVTAK